ncbi:hypothetical protein [Hymenobacter rigui]|uniref:Uncharacterized protein n=1 Tax=Hymenobacter rigui TaxID=334424 RepID=A0A3R9N7D2_9BACT|nr:hypothetical protein [Hymenobacter rigui]RSK49954.1 hypothetical protein EI291_04715 [Hymenobacter rigui]
MESVMLVSERGDLLAHFQLLIQQKLSDTDVTIQIESGDFVTERGSRTRIYFRYDGSIEDVGWDEMELEFIRHYYSTEPHVYSLNYRGIEFVKEVLTLIANSSEYLIDNDCGTLLPGDEFVQKMQQNPTWYWFDDL